MFSYFNLNFAHLTIQNDFFTSFNLSLFELTWVRLNDVFRFVMHFYLWNFTGFDLKGRTGNRIFNFNLKMDFIVFFAKSYKVTIKSNFRKFAIQLDFLDPNNSPISESWAFDQSNSPLSLFDRIMGNFLKGGKINRRWESFQVALHILLLNKVKLREKFTT